MISLIGILDIPPETIAYAEPIKHEHYKVNSPSKFKVHQLESANSLIDELSDLVGIDKNKLDFVYFSCCKGAEPHTDQLNPEKFEDTTFIIPVILPKGRSTIIAENVAMELTLGGVYQFDHTKTHEMQLEDNESGCVVIMVGILQDKWLTKKRKHMSEMNSLLVPTTIKVGYQKREDTYTGHLAYVIYYDNKNKLRKEASWQGWRNLQIEPQDFLNVPTSGFVLNKKVGGYQSYYNYRSTYVRVYDPRGFEFEITVPNLLFILANVDCTKGKGLEGEFVYGWNGSDLVLLPVNTQDYKNCMQYTKMQDAKVPAKDLVVGTLYESKKREKFLYLGKFKLVRNGKEAFSYAHTKKESDVSKPRHVFLDYHTYLGNNPLWAHNPSYQPHKGEIDHNISLDIQSRMSHAVTDSVPEFADIMAQFTESWWLQEIVEMIYNPQTKSGKVDKIRALELQDDDYVITYTAPAVRGNYWNSPQQYVNHTTKIFNVKTQQFAKSSAISMYGSLSPYVPMQDQNQNEPALTVALANGKKFYLNVTIYTY